MVHAPHGRVHAEYHTYKRNIPSSERRANQRCVFPRETRMWQIDTDGGDGYMLLKRPRRLQVKHGVIAATGDWNDAVHAPQHQQQRPCVRTLACDQTGAGLVERGGHHQHSVPAFFSIQYPTIRSDKPCLDDDAREPSDKHAVEDTGTMIRSPRQSHRRINIRFLA
jgi:hypothetical protein